MKIHVLACHGVRVNGGGLADAAAIPFTAEAGVVPTPVLLLGQFMWFH